MEKVNEEIEKLSSDKIFAVVHISKLPVHHSSYLHIHVCMQNIILWKLNLICWYCMYIGGRQFKITKNDLIVINRIAADVGEKIILE